MNPLDRIQVSKTVRIFLDEIQSAKPEIRAKLDYGFHFHKQSVELIEIRPRMLKRQGKTESPFAKATFVQSSGTWKVYWMRGTGKWHPYEPPTVRSLNAFLKLVREDEQHCFFG